jgi:hypothetical protein
VKQWIRINPTDCFIRCGQFSIAEARVNGHPRFTVFSGFHVYGEDNVTVFKSFDTEEEAKEFVDLIFSI